MNFTVSPFSPHRLADFLAVHSQANRAGWCYCVAWWVPCWKGWDQRTAEENLGLRQSLLQRGHYDGYLLYIDHQPVGWCQAGRRDRLAKLVQQFQLPPDPAVWAVTCFLITPSFRGRGLASRFLKSVLADLARQGVRRVEAFPKRGPDLDQLDLWNGPKSMFLKAGFKVVRDDPRRPILALSLEDHG